MLVAVRPLKAADLHWFARFAAGQDRGFAPESPVEFEQWLHGLCEAGVSAPDCCFVAERDRIAIGGIVYWLRGEDAHIEHVRIANDDPQLLDDLLATSLQLMRLRGTLNVWAELPSPPLIDPQLSLLKSSFERIGFGHGRERLTFMWTPDAGIADVSRHLSFRSMAEVGQQALIDALAEMSADSLDAQISSDRRIKGPLRYATEELANEAITRHEPSWWQIAYDSAGTAVGMVLAGIVGRHPAVLLVAVSPSHRGRHLARDLLNRAILTLQPVWASEQEGSIKRSVRGDVDMLNIPMAQAFRDVGFHCVRRCWQYERKLTFP